MYATVWIAVLVDADIQENLNSGNIEKTHSSTRVFHQRQNYPFIILCLCNTSLICVVFLKNLSVTSLLFCIRTKLPSSTLLSKMYCEEGRAKMGAESQMLDSHNSHFVELAFEVTSQSASSNLSEPLCLASCLILLPWALLANRLVVLYLVCSSFPWPFPPVLRFRNSCWQT